MDKLGKSNPERKEAEQMGLDNDSLRESFGEMGDMEEAERKISPEKIRDFLQQVKWTLRDKIMALTPGTVVGSSEPKSKIFTSFDYLSERALETWLNHQEEGDSDFVYPREIPGISNFGRFVIDFFENSVVSIDREILLGVPESHRKILASFIEEAVKKTEKSFPEFFVQ